MNDNLPRWNMESIYPSTESPEFLSDIDRAYELMSSMHTIEDYDECVALVITLSCWTEALLSTDTENRAYVVADSKTQLLSSEWEKRSTEFLRHFDQELPERYSFFLENLAVEKSHMMSEKEENLAASLSLSGARLWEKLQMTLTSVMSSDGRTLTELRSDSSSPDRNVRKDSFHKEKELLSMHAVSVAACLSGVKGTVLELEKRRGWKDPLERSLFSSCMKKETLDSLMDAIRSSLPMFRRYLDWKARYLSEDRLSFCDLMAPVGKSGRYTYREAEKIVIDSFASFSPDMAQFAEKAYSSLWVDASPRRGKTGGAYDTFFPLRGESRIFLNFDSTYDGVSTLAHETGHAYHDSVIKDLPPSLSSYPMTLAETASIFAERIVFEHERARTEGAEALFITEQFVSSCCQVIVDIYSRFIFEKGAFELRKEGDLTVSDLSSLMVSAQKEAYGDLEEYHEYMWAVKSHYYSEDFSYYNYPYAFGELFALSLASMKDEPGFAGKYRALLHSTGMKSVEDVALTAGIDISSPSFWKRGLDMIGDEIRRLEEWN